MTLNEFATLEEGDQLARYGHPFCEIVEVKKRGGQTVAIALDSLEEIVPETSAEFIADIEVYSRRRDRKGP